ncbi:MAG TPA: alpha/beta fold hydrolase [Streptosporangiaceae bacterium]|nr:alpha/beta fold hydrolase [Streptosporangiaceae bacterium]
MSITTDLIWFPPCRAESGAAPEINPGATTLFCLPHAGAGASVYRDWAPLLAPEIDVVPVQLPGREGRHKEPLRRSVFQLAEELIDPLASRAGPDFALFGHSVGALLGYELARGLAARGQPPRHLFVSGLPAPQLGPARRDSHLLPDLELLVLMQELEDTSPEVLAIPDLVQLLLPVMRADLEVCETYHHPHESALGVPITALGGQRDPCASVGGLQAWQHVTTADFDAEFFPGGHFYLHSLREEVIAAVWARLSGPPAWPGDGSRLPQDLQFSVSSLTTMEES